MAKCPECGVEMVHISVSKGFPWICPDCGCKAAETVLSTGTGQAPAEAPESGEAQQRQQLIPALLAQAKVMQEEARSLYQYDLEEAAALIERDGERESALRELVEAAKRIRHWHDAMPDNSGMVVSAEAVRELWETTTRCEAALPTKET